MTEPSAIHVPAGAGRPVWVFGDTYTVKVTADDTGGALGFVEATVPPGSGPRPHAHTHEDESFYVLSGEVRITHGKRSFLARAGDFVFIPKRTVHRFRNESVHAARLLFWYTPGGFERFFLEAGFPARPGELPDQPDPARMAVMARIAVSHGWQPGPGALDELDTNLGRQ
ncbi:quercetin 2,3-dioxygenase [Amycolatopsis pithecellobii]|uniref:Cupin domain-containing protein n=1 Tax=Amycolatopsis pithecellobii TaxID=664692 RepID=A0A6N7YWV0_9PSEU|nr:quercetin 2,3-dioxygenase [Amycolatopsis pithecellobii]MTD53343.1 cupin domain-containing protein [Amycolatopsis pithecellobii]